MKHHSFKSILAIAALFASVALTSCSGGGSGSNGKSDSTGNADDNSLIGAGSSFDNPLFSKMFYDYNNSNGLKVDYQSVGSGAGIAQLTSRTVDFGASDAPMNGKQDSAVTSPVLHIPVTAGAVVLSYNLASLERYTEIHPICSG